MIKTILLLSMMSLIGCVTNKENIDEASAGFLKKDAKIANKKRVKVNQADLDTPKNTSDISVSDSNTHRKSGSAKQADDEKIH